MEFQPSFTSDNTPWYFTGIRIQAFPTDRLKLELWLVNGWQTYAMFNEAPGIGYQVLWRPKESLSILSSSYIGWDTPNLPQRIRFHTDNSIVLRYLNKPKNKFIAKGAFLLSGDFGFEQGGGVVAFNGNEQTPAQNFISGMAYHRLWFGQR